MAGNYLTMPKGDQIAYLGNLNLIIHGGFAID